MCDSVNHTRFPKEDHLPDWARRDNKVTKRVIVWKVLLSMGILRGDIPAPGFTSTSPQRNAFNCFGDLFQVNR